MKFCSNCGAKLEEGVKFCPDCGQKIPLPENRTPQNPERTVQEPAVTPEERPVRPPRPPQPPIPESPRPEPISEIPPRPPVEPPRPNRRANPRPPKKSKIGLILGIVAAVVVLAIGITAIFLLTGRNDGDPALPGIYEAVSGERNGSDVSVTDAWNGGFSVELLKKGKCRITANDVQVSGKWSLEDGRLHLEGGGMDSVGTLKNGVMTLDNVLNSGIRLTLQKDGAAIPPETTRPKTTEPSQTPTEATLEPQPTQTPTGDTQPAQSQALSQRIAGIYSREESGGETMKVEVVPVGGMAVLELSRWMENSVYDFWVMEFWPKDPADWESPELTSITGDQAMFSVMSMAGQYWDSPESTTLTLTETGLVLTDGGESREFTRTDAKTAVHSEKNLLADVAQQFRPQGSRPEELTGTWLFTGETCAAALTLEPDGSACYVSKVEGQPIVLMTAGWVAEGENLVLHGESYGSGTMPRLGILTWSLENGELLLQDGEEEPILPSGGGLTFRPTEDSWAFPRFPSPLESMEAPDPSGWADLLDTYLEQEGAYVPDQEDAWEVSYSYRVPCLTVNTEGAAQINQEINSTFGQFVREQLVRIDKKEMVMGTLVEWYAVSWDNVLSIILVNDQLYYSGYAVFLYDMDSGSKLEQADLLEKMGLTEQDYLEAVRTASADQFAADCSQLTEQELQDYGYYDQLKLLEGDGLINMDNVMAYPDEIGSLVVIAPVPSVAGASWYYHYLYPEFAVG